MSRSRIFWNTISIKTSFSQDLALDDGLVRGWKNLAVDSLDTYTIPGDNYTMIRESQVRILTQ